jgi:RNA polymerase sigma-70 factor (ECF subfamily)
VIADALSPFWQVDEWMVSLFHALSSRFGGDTTSLDESTILQLIEQARAGNKSAAHRLYRVYVDRVFRTVRGILHSDADAEEVTQDAMLTMLTSLDRYAPRDGTPFIAWVMTIAMNTARRRFRRRHPEFRDPNDLPPVEIENDFERGIDSSKERAALLRALGEMTDRERAIVSLRYGSDLDASEIARILELEAANVRKILERVRSRLGVRIDEILNQRGVTR